MPINRYAETYPCYSSITLAIGQGTNPTQSSPAQTAPHRWDMILASSNAAVDHDARIEAYVGSLSYYLGSVVIPAGAGWTNVPPLDVLAALVPPSNDGITLPPSAYVRATLAVALGAGETINISLVGGLV